MPAGDYYLNKFNGSSIDEKIFIAQANKVLGFDNQLNPIMISAAYVTAMNADYIPKYNGSSFTNSCMRQSGLGIGVNYENNAEASIHAASVTGFPIAKFSSHDDQSPVYRHLFFQHDYYGGEIGLIGQVPGHEKNLLCLHTDGAIGIGYTALKVYETINCIGLGFVDNDLPQAPIHIKSSESVMAIFETTALATMGSKIYFAADYYGGELGITVDHLGVSNNLICVHQDGSIGIGYVTFKVYEATANAGINISQYNTPAAQFQINELSNSTTGTSLLIYSGEELTEGLAINVKTWLGYDALTASCRGRYAAFNFGINNRDLVTDVNIWGTLTVSGQIVSTVIGSPPFVVNNSNLVIGLNANYLEGYAAANFSTVGHTHSSYVPYAGATQSVNLGGYGIITPTITGGIIQTSSLSYIPTTYSTVSQTGPAHTFKGGNSGVTALITVLHNGQTGFGLTPTAILTIKAGTAAAGTAPLKFTSGTLLSAAAAGAMEFDGTNLYFTPSTTRYAVSLANHTHSYEPALGNPAGNGYILSSTTLGARSWIANTGHNPVTISTANGLSISVQALSMAAASTSVTGALTSTDWNTFNNKVSFPGFGTSHITAAYGDHTHSNYDNYNQWTFQPETALGAGASYTISSGYYLQLKAGTGMDLSHSITGSTVTVTLTSSGGFPGFGTTHTTAAYGDHTHSNYDNYNQWTFQAFNGAYDEFTVLSGNTLRFSTGPNIEFDLADLAADGILVMSVVNIPDIILTGYTYGSIGLIAATDSLKVGLSKLQTQMPKTLYYDISDYTNVGSTVNDISPYTLPANTLAYDGQRLELVYSGSSAANTNAKTIQFYFGGTSYITITNSSATSLNWFLRITIIRYSSTYFKLRFDGGWNVVGYGTGFGMSINYAANNTIKLTAQGGATNDITCKLVTITQFSI